ncbi:hypothetical protein CLOM_g1880 [Closterium sp. NIES-68]|nr:hypothetical protein CLOM_g1880 [Closterium sp. NIES-68]
MKPSGNPLSLNIGSSFATSSTARPAATFRSRPFPGASATFSSFLSHSSFSFPSLPPSFPRSLWPFSSSLPASSFSAPHSSFHPSFPSRPSHSLPFSFSPISVSLPKLLLSLILFSLLLLLAPLPKWPKRFHSPFSVIPPPPDGLSFLPSRCPAACSRHGSCNEEAGRCDCLPGYTGVDCTELGLPSCRYSWGVEIPCFLPSSCDCALECERFFLPHDEYCFPNNGTLWKERTIGAIVTRMPLHLQTDGNGTETGPREPFSIGTPTDTHSDSSSSSNGPAVHPAAAITASPLLFPSVPLPAHPFPWLVPLNNCPNYCSGRGLCDATYWECRCPWYHDGSGCEDDSYSVACLNECSQRGDCEGGVCQCQAGFFGADCSLYYNEELRLRRLPGSPFPWADLPEADTFAAATSPVPSLSVSSPSAAGSQLPLSLQNQPQQPGQEQQTLEQPPAQQPPQQEQQQQNQVGAVTTGAAGGTAGAAGAGAAAVARLKVYVYELPPHFNTWQMQHSPYIDHPEALWFWERLLASRHRTIDPREADFFYVPLLIRNRDSGKQRLISEAISFIRSLGPFWDAKGGADHIFLVSEEFGKCGLERYGEEDPRLASAITLTPWGYTRNMLRTAEGGPCFRPGQDIVIPPSAHLRFLSNVTMVREAGGLPGLVRESVRDGEQQQQEEGHHEGQQGEGSSEQEQLGKERQYLLYVRGLNVSDDSGGWGEETQHEGQEQQEQQGEQQEQQQREQHHGEPPFSFGVRQRVFELYAGRDGETGFKVEVVPEGGDELAYGGMQESVFCLATAGHGWHASLAMAVMAGCVPVVIQPDVLLPFEGDGVDWSLLSYRLSIRDIPQLHERLQAIPPEDIEVKQKRLQQLWPLFIWSAPQFNPVDFLPEGAQMLVTKVLAQYDAFSAVMFALARRVGKAGGRDSLVDWYKDGETGELQHMS